MRGLSRRDALMGFGSAATLAVPAAATAGSAAGDPDSALEELWSRWQIADETVQAADSARLDVMEAMGGRDLAEHFSGDRINAAFAAAEQRCIDARRDREAVESRILATPAAGTTGALVKLRLWAGNHDSRFAAAGSTREFPAAISEAVERLGV